MSDLNEIEETVFGTARTIDLASDNPMRDDTWRNGMASWEMADEELRKDLRVDERINQAQAVLNVLELNK